MPPRRAASKRKNLKEESSDDDNDMKVEEEEEEENEEVEKPPMKSKRLSEKQSAKVAAKKEEDSKGDKLGLKWEEDGTLMILDSPNCKGSEKVVAFDMDHTLIAPKSGAKFPKNRNDWDWLYEDIPKVLKELNEKGYKLVIFTNQAGIEKNKQKPGDIKGKIIDMCAELGFPMQAFVAAATDINRKPNITMWKLFTEKYNGGKEVDHKLSSFVGDAAGRAKNWKEGASKDFSCGDRAFAHNIGLEFKTPDEFFLKEDAAPFQWDSIDPESFLKTFAGKAATYTEKDILGDSKGQELVLLVGRPASGKSTFAKKYFVKNGYVHVNMDTLKTKAKCIKVAKEAIDSGKSVVVDNTNPSMDSRAEFTSIAKAKKIPFRCFYFDTDEDLAYHLNYFREKVTNGDVRRIPDVGYNMYKSKFKEPTTAEGFTSVTKISFFPDFQSDEMKKLFLQRTC